MFETALQIDLISHWISLEMIKILILTYDYPPYVSVGSLRPYSWFQYMNEFGASPVVITRQWKNEFRSSLDYVAASDSPETLIENTPRGTVIRTPHKPNLAEKLLIKYGESRFRLIRKFISAFYELGQYVFLIGPRINLYVEARKYLSENKVDLIIATGEPFVLFRYASLLGKEFDVPWIADYRDPWTQDKERRAKGIPEAFDAFFEKKCVADASAVVTVSKFFQRKIEKLIAGKTFFIVPNGYDPDAVGAAAAVNQNSEKLSIGFVGTISKWHPVESFLRVADDFAGSNQAPKKFEINFYGINIEDQIREWVKTKFPNLESVVKIYPKMPNQQLLVKLAADNIFLAFNQYTNTGTKIYDYIALKRRIIMCYGDDPESKSLEKFYNLAGDDVEIENLQNEILEKTNLGVIIKDAEHLKSFLEESYALFLEKGLIPTETVDTESYSRKVQVKRLVEFASQFVRDDKKKSEISAE